MNVHRDSLAADARRLEDAADWMLRLRAGDAGEDDIVQWVRWCEADPANQAAFDRVQALWQTAGALERDASEASSPPGGDASGPASIASTRADATRRLHVRRHARPRLRVALAACVIAAAGGLAWWGSAMWRASTDVHLAGAQVPVTSKRLADGSTVDLAARSTVDVSYSSAERGLELGNGEAFFSVQPQKDRPFVVHAGPVSVRAVGTAFNVRRAGNRVVVTVTEGKVEVFPSAQSMAWASNRSVPVRAGQQLRWDGDSAKTAPSPQASRNPLAWREGRLEYTDEPLHAVIADLNRYSTRPIVIVGDQTRALRFSGTVLTSAVPDWLSGLPDVFAVSIHEENEVTVIQARAALLQ